MSDAQPLPMSDWPTSRRVAAGAFIALGFAALFSATIYASAALFLLLNKTHPGHASFLSIVRYWQFYADDPPLRKKLITSMTVSGVSLLLVLPAAMVNAARTRRPLHGNARFARLSEIRQAGLFDSGDNPAPSILLGRYRGRFLALAGQLSVMLSASPRSGKGAGIVVPNLLNWKHSAVVLDVKGENFALTAGYRAKHGQAVYAFSPFDETARSHRWNPLSAIRTDSLFRVGDLLTVGQVFFPNEGIGNSSEAFFNDHARNLFLGLGLLLLETPALPRTIGEMLRQASGKGQSLPSHLRELMAARQAQGQALSDECVDALQRLLSSSENTLTSIVATFNAPLLIFADAIVDASTSASDFDLADVRRRPMTVYVRIPPNRLASARPLLNLFFSQLIHLNTQLLPEQDTSLKLQCLLVNDEFAALGRVGILASASAFLGGYGLRLLTIIQAMSQMESLYGEKEARSFASNHGLQILYAPREQRDADEYSAMLGQFTETGVSRGRSQSFSQHGTRSVSRNESEQRRPLLLPQEFKELGSERLVLILENCKPILAKKIRYYREPEFRERLLPPPEVPKMDMDLHIARIQERWRELPDELPVDERLDVAALNVNLEALPSLAETMCASNETISKAYLTFFTGLKSEASGPAGGEIEACPDQDGVLVEHEVTLKELCPESTSSEPE
ncbi:conjugal transfer protein TraG [Paucibacter sp. KBW04]|uniref:type IV secretory system conjugative DNA transfer family protein n=1 Tax=Paucibacter sp. KBW04 TaxID=2153361 RepID=UPI000F5642A7|nr:type IV secretory system conjugative DNA transfer family protein [Paucibacter sp. KBW04]RQO53244.1 conjugal transfer protein TraG [Paucibacter sp. KBW04]